jgi:acetolactate synthase regulatory subunit
MDELTFEVEIRDQPDVLVRIMQTIHRQGGHVRSLQVEPGARWASVHITAQGLTNYNLVIQKLAKLIDVRRVRLVTKQSNYTK